MCLAGAGGPWSRRDASEIARPSEHRVQHRFGYPASERVLLTRVVAAECGQARAATGGRRPDRYLDAMPERGPWPRRVVSGARELRPQSLPGVVAEAHDHPQATQDQTEL